MADIEICRPTRCLISSCSPPEMATRELASESMYPVQFRGALFSEVVELLSTRLLETS